MRNTQVTPDHRLYWLVGGWRIFAEQPATWIAMSLLYISVGLAVLSIPVVGTLTIALVWPALTAGLVHGANEVGQGRMLKISHLFEMFRQREFMRSLLVFGLVLASMVVVHTSFSMLLWSKGNVDSTVPAIAAITGTLIISGIFFYAIPSVVIGKATPLRAIKDSIVTGATNTLQISLFATAYLALLVLALIPHGLGLVVLIPVTAGAMYTSYKRVSTEYRTQSAQPALDTLQTNQIEKASKSPSKRYESIASKLGMAVMFSTISSDTKNKRG